MEDYLDFCLDAMTHGEIIQRGRRQFLKHEGKLVPLGRALWNAHFPDDPVGPAEVIHHLDHDPSNNEISNLQKLPETQHQKVHERERTSKAKLKPKYIRKAPAALRKACLN